MRAAASFRPRQDHEDSALPHKIAFVGNCQMLGLKSLYDTFVAGHTGDKTVFLPSYKQIDQAAAIAFQDVTLLVEQVQELAPEATLPQSVASTERCLVPLVSCAFLWPFAGEQHPQNGDQPFLEGGPYPGELGDTFLNRAIQPPIGTGSTRQTALISNDDSAGLVARYRQHEFRAGLLDRRYELVMDRQRRRDEICAFSIAEDIERYFRSERIFFSPHHPDLRISRSLAMQCFRRIGAPQICLDLLETQMRRSPFPRDELPIHPAVAKHFSLGYVSDSTRYHFRGEGDFTWAEWVARYIGFVWEPAIHEGASIVEANPAKARDLLRDGLGRAPRSAIGHHALSRALLRLGDHAAAATESDTALGLAPDEPDIWRSAAFLAWQSGRLEDACYCADRCVVLDPSNLANLGLLAKLQEELGNFTAAEATRRRILALSPLSSLNHGELGTNLMHQRTRKAEALAEYQKAIELDPRNGGACFGGSLVLAELDRVDDAIHAVSRAIAINPAVSLYHSHLGHLLARARRPAEAVDAFRRALEFEPNNAGLHASAGDLLLQQEKPQEAMAHLQRAADLAPDDLRAKNLLQKALERIETAAAPTVPSPAPAGQEARGTATTTDNNEFALVPSPDLAQDTLALVPGARLVTPKCLIYTNFPALNPEFAGHHLSRLYVERERSLPPVVLCRLPPSTRLAVPNGEDFFPIIDNRVAADQVRPGWRQSQLGAAIAACTGHDHIEGPAVLIGRYGVRTWGHWLGELLPKLVAVEASNPGYFRYILPDRFVSDRAHQSGLESLEYYGIGRDRLALVASGMSYQAPNLHLVTPAWSPDHMIHPAVAELMRTRAALPSTPGDRPKKIALLRRYSRSRNLDNAADVERCLVSAGWTLIDLEIMPFREQVAHFETATAIVSILGSGLTSLLYSPRGVKVITLAPSHWGDLFFFALMQERNAELVDLRGTSVAGDPAEVATANFRIDIAELEKGLAALQL